jgi:hypothetical protein
MDQRKSLWQRFPAVLVALAHAIGGVAAAGALFAGGQPGAGYAAGGVSLVGVLTSAVLALHMFSPATVEKADRWAGEAGRFAGVLEKLLAEFTAAVQPAAQPAVPSPTITITTNSAALTPAAVPVFDHAAGAGLDPSGAFLPETDDSGG